MMDSSFPEAWSDDDSSELDEFLSKPWPDENRNSVRTNEEGWPEFEPKWRHFSSNHASKIVSISSVPFDEEDDRNEVHNRTDWIDTRDDDDDDESVLTLSSMAGATAELASSARQTTPTKPELPQRLLRQKLPMLLCKSERLKQASPGDKRVRFADCSNEDNIPLDPIIEIGVDTLTERMMQVVKPPAVIKAPVVPKPPRRTETRSASRPVVQKQKPMSKDLCFQDAPLEAYSGKCSSNSWIHNANLFEDKTLPSNTLDFFCRDSSLAAGVPHVQEVSYSEEDTTVTSSESSGSGISSLPGGAVDEKLAQLFSLSSIHEERRDPPPQPRPPTPARKMHTRARHDPVPEYTANVTSHGDVEMTAPSEVSSETPYYNHHAHTSYSHIPPSGTKVADRQKWLNAAFQRPKNDLDGRPGVPVSNVKGTIEKFGGRAGRVNAVKQKKEELERKLAEKNKGPPTIKSKWEGRPGSYKKKIVLSSYH